MSRRKRTDANQSTVVKELRLLGMSVEPLHFVGRGFPDLVVGYGGKNYLFELKDGAKSLSQQRLTPDEVAWLALWKGQVAVVNSTEEIIKQINNEGNEQGVPCGERG